MIDRRVRTIHELPSRVTTASVPEYASTPYRSTSGEAAGRGRRQKVGAVKTGFMVETGREEEKWEVDEEDGGPEEIRTSRVICQP